MDASLPVPAGKGRAQRREAGAERLGDVEQKTGRSPEDTERLVPHVKKAHSAVKLYVLQRNCSKCLSFHWKVSG